jgi:germination protein M
VTTNQRHAAPLVVLIIVTLLAACAPSTGGLGTVPPLPSAPAPSVGQASPDLTPGPAPSASAPSTSTPSSPAPSAASPRPSIPAPIPSPGEATSVVRAYFHLNGGQGTAGLVPVLREVPATQAVATAAMTGLLAGPTGQERDAMSSTIPAGTRLLGLSIAGQVATVDLSSEFESGGGSASVLGRLAQVVYTLTQFPTVTSVSFRIEGRPVTVFSGEGVVLDGPVDRADYEYMLPAIFVDRPAYGAAIDNPGRIAGSANVFEATLQVTLLDGPGSVLANRVVTATCGTGCRGTFDVSVGYQVQSAQWGTLRAWAASAQDGRPVNVRDYPVWLTPTR